MMVSCTRVKLKWYDKLFGVTIKSKTKATVIVAQKELQKSFKRADDIKEVQDELGIEELDQRED